MGRRSSAAWENTGGDRLAIYRVYRRQGILVWILNAARGRPGLSATRNPMYVRYWSAMGPSPREGEGTITSVTFEDLPFRFTLKRPKSRFEEQVISSTNLSQGARAASARAFVHSLNILIKYARMYGYEHKRTEAQFETTWNELQTALPAGGFLLGVTDNRLLLDGIPLESGQAEKSFATLLTT